MSNTGKEVAIFPQVWSPHKSDVTYIAVNTRTRPHRVFHTYLLGEKLPDSGFIPGVIVLPITEALQKYEFQAL